MSEETRTEETGKKLEDIKKDAEERACPVQRTLYFIEEFIAGPCSNAILFAGTGEEIRLRGSAVPGRPPRRYSP
jgi:hypothetical protein